MKSILRELEHQNEVVLASKIKKVLATETPDEWKKDYPQIKSWGRMTTEILEDEFPWFLKARVKDAEIEYEDGFLAWKTGIWKGGTWKDGRWEGGTWKNGIWKNGLWEDGVWEDGVWKSGTWSTGIWNDGIWEDGIWERGYWLDGTWEKGKILNKKTRKYEPSKTPPL